MLKKIQTDRDTLVMRYPAAWSKDMWREAIPLGNGVMGASVLGSVKNEIIAINHSGLWNWGIKDEVPDVSDLLKETRHLMDTDRVVEANVLLSNTLKEKGYETTLAYPVPLGDIKVNMIPKRGFSAYQRLLNMRTAEAVVDWTDDGIKYRREGFVSRTDDILVYRISSDDDCVSAEIALDVHRNGSKKTERMQEIESTVKKQIVDNYMYYSAVKSDNGTNFGMVARVVATGGTVEEVRGTLHVDNAESILIIAKIFIESEYEKEWKNAKAAIDALPADYDVLLERHIPEHEKLYTTASIELSDEKCTSNEELLLDAFSSHASPELVEKLWRFGRYIFIAGTDPKTGLLFPMYGLWHGDYDLIWTHNMANENVEMIYWHANVGGLATAARGLFDYYLNMMDDYRKNAKNLYGCNGIYVPAGSSPGLGVPNQVVPVIMNWTGAGAWLAQFFYLNYVYTKDKDFLVNKALPFMYEVALFYEDFITYDENGKIKMYPSVSPENTPNNYLPRPGSNIKGQSYTAVNATMDFALIKELFTNIIAAAKETGLHTDKIETWEKIIAAVPRYELNDKGAVKEWQDPGFDDRYDHRHLSHLYPVFPGYEINSENEPDLFKAFETAVNLRKIDSQSGWSLAHMSCIYSRFGLGEKAMNTLYNLARSCIMPNLLSLHNDWRNMGITMGVESCPIQLDANMGIVNAIQEMLMYSSEILVKLLPALPSDLTDGKVTDFVFAGGKASFEWHRRIGKFNAIFTATRDITIDIKMPDEFGNYVYTCSNAEIINQKGNVITVAFKNGGSVKVDN